MFKGIHLYIIRVTILLVGVFLARSVLAQLDPSSSVLIRGRSDETVQPNLDSGRYTVKSPGSSRVVKSESVDNKSKQNGPAPTQLQTNQAEVPLVSTQTQDQTQTQAHTQTETESPKQMNKKNILDTLRESLLEASETNDAWAKEGRVHPEDSRQNIMNISVGPTLMYVDSSSAYWYRNYHSSGPGIDVGVDVWLNANFGIIGNYQTSLTAEINSEATTEKTTIVDHRLTEFGFATRRYSSESRRSPWFIWSAKYSEYHMIVPKAETQRVQVKSSGLSLGVEGNIPISNSTIWFFSGELLPKLNVTEGSTGVAAKSGNDPSSYAVAFQLGQRFSLNRKNHLYWRLTHRFDKTVYKGAATEVDPRTSVAPEGVSVNSGMTVFGLGFTWGD